MGKLITVEKIRKKESKQSKLVNYISSVGKWLLYILPIILLVVTILSFISVLDLTLKIVYIAILAVYSINSLILFLGAFETQNSLNMRLKFERTKGRPIDSLDGFDLLSSSVSRVINLLVIIALVCWVSIVLFIIMLALGDLNLGFAAAGFALVGLGLAFLIRSLNLNIHDVNGLQDFYKPTTHQIFLDNFFSEILSNHLDPVTYLKWDEYLAKLDQLLMPSFVEKIKSQEAEELPVTFAIEKLLFLYYLRFQDVISDELLTQELEEIIDVDSDDFDIENGLMMEGAWYFSRKDIYKLFDYIRAYNPGFFKIIDRLQLELADNIERISRDPIYMDSCAQEAVYLNSELNVMVFLYNNAKDDKRYRLRINAPGFEPDKLILDVKVEGRGSFEIPDHSSRH